MKKLSLALACFLIAASVFATDQPTIQSLVGRVFFIEDDWAGQELAFRSKENSVVAIWRVLGSGRPILFETEYPVEIKNPRQCVFEVQLGDDYRHKVKIELGDRGEVRAFLNRVRIQLEERKPN